MEVKLPSGRVVVLKRRPDGSFGRRVRAQDGPIRVFAVDRAQNRSVTEVQP